VKRLEETIQMDLREMGCKDEKGTELAQNRVQWRALVFASGYC
jgi:hypothetical protein